MDVELLWWHWVAIGMLLMLAEILVPSFTIFWFGLAGLVVAALLWLLPGLALSWQLTIWALASIGSTVAWFRVFKPTMVDRTMAGISRKAVVGETGQVIRATQEGRRGVVRFPMPLLGADEWEFIATNKMTLGSIIGEMELAGALSSGDQIKAKRKANISDDILDRGITLKTVEIQDIKPSATMQTAMEEQATILQEEGRFEASKRDAQAKILLAQASQQAIEKVAQAIQEKELPVVYLLGEKYIEAIKGLSESPNGKTILLPSDIPAAVRGIIGALGT